MDWDPGLVAGHVDTFNIIERTTSVFSLLGSVVVIATFCLSKAFHKPINRLVFYASFGNLMTNVATLVARTFIGNSESAGCQFQAFLIQMFMPADAYWTLAMALNVYLTFYFKFDAQQLRKMEVPYLLLCYGIPFIIALTFIFVSTEEKGRMYGNATLWCWISPQWDIFRIAAFYAPIWIVIFITFFIYGRAGREIYKKHKQLREFSTSHHDPEPFSGLEDLFSSTKTTEVFVTTEVVDKSQVPIDLAPLEPGRAGRRASSVSNTNPKPPPKAAYSVSISANRRRESQGDIEAPIQPQTTIDSQTTTIAAGSSSTGARGGTNTNAGANKLRRRAAYEANSATWSYTKCAILFFTAMLVTWIPSSSNRVYSLVKSGHASLALEYMSAFVLPLQGFWNAIIYMVTSWGACKMLWEDICVWFGARRRRRGGLGGGGSGLPNPQDLVPGIGHLHHHHHPNRSAFQMMSSGRNGSKASDSKAYETESMTELAGSSRPGSSAGPNTPSDMMDSHPHHHGHHDHHDARGKAVEVRV